MSALWPLWDSRSRSAHGKAGSICLQVTTSNDLELVIDGVSIVPPRNDFKAFHANISRHEKILKANIGFDRSVQFADFDIAKEIEFFSEAVNMFAERVT